MMNLVVREIDPNLEDLKDESVHTLINLSIYQEREYSWWGRLPTFDFFKKWLTIKSETEFIPLLSEPPFDSTKEYSDNHRLSVNTHSNCTYVLDNMKWDMDIFHAIFPSVAPSVPERIDLLNEALELRASLNKPLDINELALRAGFYVPELLKRGVKVRELLYVMDNNMKIHDIDYLTYDEKSIAARAEIINDLRNFATDDSAYGWYMIINRAKGAQSRRFYSINKQKLSELVSRYTPKQVEPYLLSNIKMQDIIVALGSGIDINLLTN